MTTETAFLLFIVLDTIFHAALVIDNLVGRGKGIRDMDARIFGLVKVNDELAAQVLEASRTIRALEIKYQDLKNAAEYQEQHLKGEK